MATIRIDDRSYEVEAGRNLLEVVLSRSIDLPYFCWHPEMGSIGACRQCAVMQYTGDSDETGRLVMACMTPVADGMRFSVEAPHARDFRTTIIEWLMVNHPHDCPVCEEGGECHLQDMTVMAGHSMRVYPGPKRTWRNQYLGPFLNHEMNRCITCYRCVRFYRDYAGGTDLEDFGSRDRVYFGRAEDGVLESEFSGNLVEVCPTGVFTDRPFARRYTRKWDLVSAPSVCAGCSLGCATLAGSRYDEFRRIHNRYHPDINRYFLCDRGRFGQDWIDGPERIRQPGKRGADDRFDPVDPDRALAGIGAALDGARVVGVGSPRASLETNFALARLVGREHFCAGFALDETEPVRAAVSALRAGRARIPTLAEVEAADAVLVLGEDPIDSAPRLALSLRQAVMAKARETAADAGIPPWQDAGVRSHGRYSRHPLYLATLLPSRSADLAAGCFQGSPEDLARLGESIAAAVRNPGAAEDDFVRGAAEALRSAERPLIVSGTSLGDASVVAAARSVADALADAGSDVACMMLPREADAVGAALLDAHPDTNLDLEAVLRRLEADSVDVLLVAENDLTRRADPERVQAALARAGTVVVIDAVEHDTAAAADWLLPATAQLESQGTLVNNEGRAQRFYPAMHAAEPLRPAWRWLTDLAVAVSGPERNVADPDALVEAIAVSDPVLAGVRDAAPPGDWRDTGGLRVARAPERQSGRTAAHAHLDIHEPVPPVDADSPLAWSMEGTNRPSTPAALTPYYRVPRWNSNQAVTRFQEEVAGPLRGGEVGRRLLFPNTEEGRTEPVGAASAANASPRQADDEPAGAAHGPHAAANETRPNASGKNSRLKPLPQDADHSSHSDSDLRIAPIWHIFGSDELSARAPALMERMPVPRLVLAPGVAEAYGLTAGEGVRLRIDGADRGVFRLEPEPVMAAGWVAVSCGLPGTPGSTPVGRVSLEAVPDWTPPAPDGVIARG